MVVMVVGAPAWSADLLVDDFNGGSTPSLQGRIYEHRLDADGWIKAHGWAANPNSEWDITGGRLQNPSTNTTYYSAGETPAFKWWTNPETNSARRDLRVSFDYGVDAGSSDTLTAHFWAVQKVDVAATGPTTIDTADSNQLIRTSGSFRTDGFVTGHNVRLTAGFVSNPSNKTYTITWMSADGLTITINADGSEARPYLVTEAGSGDEDVNSVGPSFISNNQGWANGNSGQNQNKSLNYDTFNLLNGDTTPDNTAHISGHLTGTGTFVWEMDVASLGIPGVATVGDIDTLFIAFAANETGGGTTWIDNLTVSDWPPNVLTEDFSAVGTPPDQWRVYEWLLDTGWNATRRATHFSKWDVVSNRLENPSVGQDNYIEGESPAWKWWTNHESDNAEPGLRVTFDYGVGAGSNDTLSVHFWAVQTNGPTGASDNFISNIEAWQNGNSGGNLASSTNGFASYNLLDAANPPGGGGSISGHLTGTGTFEWQVDLVKLGIPGVTTVGDVDTFFIAFAANETGGGTTYVDNVSIDAIHIPRGLRVIVR